MISVQASVVSIKTRFCQAYWLTCLHRMSPEQFLRTQIKVWSWGSFRVWSFTDYYAVSKAEKKVTQAHGWNSVVGWRQGLHCSCSIQPAPLAEPAGSYIPHEWFLWESRLWTASITDTSTHWKDTWKWTHASHQVLSDFVLLRQWPKPRQRQARTRSHSFD